MEEPASQEIEKALDAERQANAAEVAEVFTKHFGKPDAAENALENLLLDCNVLDPIFWREVTTALAQIRG